MNSGLGTDTITVIRAALVVADRYGNKTRDWAGAARTTVTGVSVQPVGSDEAVVDREWAAAHLRLFAPPGTDLTSTDRVAWRGDTYEVDGTPRRWFDDEGVEDHTEADLKRMTG